MNAALRALVPLVLATTVIAQEAPVQSMRVISDRGTFTYYSNEDAVGTSKSIWGPDGSFENESLVRMGGQEVPGTLKIEVDDDGLWTSITMGTLRGTVKVAREGDTATVTLGDQTNDIELPPGTLLLEDMSPALMSQAVAAYDHGAGGTQAFPVFFVPAVVINGSVEYLDTFERHIGNEPHEFRRYEYRIPGIYDIRFTVDEKGAVCFAEYPEQHGTFVRTGYDALAISAESDALLSPPAYEVIVEKGVGVPMRDGVALATDIYRPEGVEKAPVILVRTPYQKEMGELQARFYARRGYAFAVQDVRGRFSSPGEWRPFVHEAEDGYDAIEWLATRDWANGRVGMIGASYLGWVQWWAASRKPPHLVTIIPNVAPPSPYFNIPYESGGFFLSGALFWTMVIANDATADLSGVSMEGAIGVLDAEKMDHLPVIELDEKIIGEKVPFWREFIAHPDMDEHWQGLDFISRMKDVTIPIYHQSGWFDGDGIGSKRNYLGMAAHGHRRQKLVLGPWGHRDTDTRSGPHGIDWGPHSVIDLQRSYLRWMDRWLKGIENGIDEEPSVSLFVMGANDWLHGETYPLEGTEMIPYYLSGGEGEEGLLTWDIPSGDAAAPEQYVYDPGDPTPIDPDGRDDLLEFVSPPYEEPLTIAGPMSVVLYAASSARDTDWFVRLAKLRTDGNPLLLGRGVIRARHRESFSKPQLLEPGEICEYHLDLWQTGVRVEKGERLIVVVSSALFPMFSRNLNTGGHNETETEYVSATQTIYHDDAHPSHLLLPVIPDPVYGVR